MPPRGTARLRLPARQEVHLHFHGVGAEDVSAILARVNGAELEYVVQGTGEPVVLIHGALIAEAYAPLCAST